MDNFKDKRILGTKYQHFKINYMKKLFLSILSISYLVSFGAGLTIEKADLKWTVGNKWYMAITPGQQISSFITTGTGVTWDLSSFELAPGKDTIEVSAPKQGSGSVVNIKSNIIPETNYTETAANYSAKTIFYLNNNYDLAAALTTGLSHQYQNTWNDATNAYSGLISITVNGEVVAEGQVTTSFGTFDCILVQESYNISGNVSTYYYWETKEFGRIAYFIEGNLSVMLDNNFNPPTNTQEISVVNVNVYPNPTTDQFTVRGDLLKNVKVFDALGNLVLNTSVTLGSININTNEFKNGLYFVQATSLNGVSTKSLIVK